MNAALLPLLAARTGRGVSVAVVDSGMNPGHPHLRNVGEGIGIRRDGSEHPDWLDLVGHGTAVAAAIHEKAPGALLHPVKVFERSLSTDVAALVAGIAWAARRRVRLVNLSLGTSNADHEEALRDAVARAASAGVLVVAAVGDDGQRWLPGALPGVVPVRLDWDCPREQVRSRVGDDGTWCLEASGYPREIPGVPKERNLKGISFAVANATGFLCRVLEGLPAATLEELRARLSQG